MSEDSPPIEGATTPYSDNECILTLNITEGDIPILFCQAIQNGEVLKHPNLSQIRPIPETERDPDLELVVPVGSVTDPDAPVDSSHILAPLFQKASLNEELVMVSYKHSTNCEKCHQHQFSALPLKHQLNSLGLNPSNQRTVFMRLI